MSHKDPLYLDDCNEKNKAKAKADLDRFANTEIVCKHIRLKFLGLQETDDLPLLALFNCLDCKSTISMPYISPLDVSKTIRKACKDSKKEQSRKSITIYVQNGIITKCNRLNLG